VPLLFFTYIKLESGTIDTFQTKVITVKMTKMHLAEKIS